MQSRRPLLVVVSGAPASGKTTLATRLAVDGELTLVSKDAVKEALADTLGHPDSVEALSTLGIGAYAAMFAMAKALLESGVDLAVESNFRRGKSEPELISLASAADGRVIHCVATPPTIRERYGNRTPDRHPAHLDVARHEDVMRDLADGRYEPLDLGWPTKVVATDEGYRPSYDELRAFALSRSSG